MKRQTDDYILTLSATSGAAADGTATNTVTVVLQKGQEVISGEQVDLSLSSLTARFTGNSLNHTTVTTDVLGSATADLTDTVEEEVTVSATLLSDTTVTQQATTTFGGDGGQYPAPVVPEASNGVLDASLSQATVNIAPYDGMAAGDTVDLRWDGTEADGAPLTWSDSVTVDKTDTVTFTVPGAQIAPLEGGSVDVTYQVNGTASESLLLVVAGAPDDLLAAPSVREAPDGIISPSVSAATVDIAPYTGMAAGDLIEMVWNGSVTGAYSRSLTVTSATAGQTVSLSVPSDQIKTNHQIGLNYTVTPADGSQMRISLPLALAVI